MNQYKESLWQLLEGCNNETGFFTAAGELLGKEIGYKLLTFTVLHPNGKFIRRIFSSNREVYPVGDDKPVADNFWAELTIRKQQSFIGNNPAEIEKYFFDHKVITSLGCESILNQVVVFNGSTIGTINLLNLENYFQPTHLEKTKLFSQIATPYFLDTYNHLEPSDQ